MGAKSLLAIASVALLTLLYLIYMALTFEAPAGTTTVVVPTSTSNSSSTGTGSDSGNRSAVPNLVERPPAPPTVSTDEPVEIARPPEELQPQTNQVDTSVDLIVDLPSLNNSDNFVTEKIREMQNGMNVLRYVTDEQLIRRFVVFVDNVSKGVMPQANPPFRPVQEEIEVDNIDENLFVMDDEGFDRFDTVFDTFMTVDSEQAMRIYRMLSPLFQQAYAEIGFRDVDFDDTVRRAITAVLRTDDRDGPFQLVKPSVMYLYADSSIENLSDVEKQLIRIGPENRDKLKAKLRQFLMLL